MSRDAAPRPLATLVVPHRFRGPRTSGNGGYTAGLLARHVRRDGWYAGAVEVTIRKPPPLDTPLAVLATETGVEARSDGRLIAAATPVPGVGHTVEAVSFDEARTAEAAYGGLARHPFPECFACGTGRTPGDALALRPGVVGNVRDRRTACTWVPDADLVGSEVTWAALDCPGGWAADVAGRPIVLGRITAEITTVPASGTRCVVVGALLDDQDGRKVHTASTVYDEDGQVLARARHVWLTVDPAAFGEAAVTRP